MKKLLIIDGNSILNRAFYGVAPLSASDGTPTGAVFGFIKILKRHVDSLSPDHMACAFDLPSPTFRHKMYDGYKANRSGMPEDLAVQLPFARSAAAAMGFKIVAKEGYEADDIIGTLAAAGSERGIGVYILTGDRDSLQLINENVNVILAKNHGDVLFDKDRFFDEYGIVPEKFVDVKALMGDSSDNIPGVKGVGEKTALKLISEAGSLDMLYSNPAAFGAKGAVLSRLEAGRDDAFLSKRLSQIDCDVPGLDLDGIFSVPEKDDAALAAQFEKLEFHKLISDFGLDRPENVPDASGDPDEYSKYSSSDTVDVGVSELCLSVTDGDIPVCIVDSSDSAVIVSAFCGGKTIRANIPYDEMSAASDFFNSHGLICFNFKEICKILHKYGIYPSCRFDSMLAAYLMSPGEGIYSEERTVEKYLPGSGLTGAAAAAALYDKLYAVIAECGMKDLLEKIEQPLSPVLADMELEGFAVDGDGIHRYVASLSETADRLADQIYMKAGRRINLNSPKQLGELLFEDLGLPSGRKTKTGYSTDAKTLERLRPYSDVVADILDYRQLSKLCGTYGDSLAALSLRDGRIHTKFHQTGTATGRLSSSDPNMQNIPVRDELGRELRKYFTARASDRVLIDGDYSQIELRLLAELSGDERMIQAFIDGEDIHRRTASQVFRVPFDMVTPELRTRAKAVNFGIVYGIGAFSLSQDLHVSRKTAEDYINSYLSTYSGVDRFLKSSVEDARSRGYALTMFGRRRYIPEINSKNKNLRAFGERVAMNSPVQGSAADIIKIAMINVADALARESLDARLILQVHDELIIDSALSCADRVKDLLRFEMEHAVNTRVPLSVEVSSGYSWYDAK